jgi:hypothetical protein
MKKSILAFFALGFIIAATSSCKKCYHCEKSFTTKDINGADSSYILQNDLCSTGKEGAGTTLSKSIEDVEKNGYTCTSK